MFSWCRRVLRLCNLLEPGREDGADDELQRVLQQQRRAEHRKVGPPREDDLEERQSEGERFVGRAHDEGDAVARLECTRSAAHTVYIRAVHMQCTCNMQCKCSAYAAYMQCMHVQSRGHDQGGAARL